MTDLTKCPNCGGPADNGYDRCFPPNPYFCTKCNEPTRPEQKVTPPVDGQSKSVFTPSDGDTPVRGGLELREMLRSMQAGEMTVSRGIELIDVWLAGRYSDDLLPPVRDLDLGEDDTPANEIEALRARVAELEAKDMRFSRREPTALREQLAAAQLQIQGLRDALKEIADNANSEFEDGWCGDIAIKALALSVPSDTGALDKYAKLYAAGVLDAMAEACPGYQKASNLHEYIRSQAQQLRKEAV